MSSLALWAWMVLTAASFPPSFSASGTVVDPEGKPVKGATVWLTTYARYDADVVEVAQVETDADGRFAIAIEVPAPADGKRSRPMTLWAHAPGMTVASAWRSNVAKGDWGPVRLALGAPARTLIRVRRVDGKPVAGAAVHPTSLAWPAGLRARLKTTTDDRGLATIEGVEPGQIGQFDVQAEGFGMQRHQVALDQAEKRVQLLPLGRVSMRVVSDDPKALAGWTVVALSHPVDADEFLHFTNAARGQSDAAGKIALDPLAAGRVELRIEPPEGSPFLVLPGTPARVTLRGGDDVEVKIPVKNGVKVEGSVREHSGRPAAGVKVNLHVLSPYRRSDDVITDAEGRFSRCFLPCKLRVSLTWFALPDRYYHAPDAHWADHDIADGAEAQTIAPLEVWPAVAIRGTVVDEAGKPVAGAGVSGSGVARPFEKGYIPGQAETDARGSFVLGRMAPDSTVEVKARMSDRAESAPVTVRLDAQGNQDRPVTLRLIRRPTVSVRGRVLGPDRRPMAGVQVAIEYRKPGGQYIYGYGKGEPTFTGADGRFQTADGVPRSDQYRARVNAPGMEPGLSAWTSGVELPDLVLRRALRLRTVDGRVVDADGRPVAGAEVFQSGDGPRRTSDTTGPDGRFAVPEVFDAPAFVLVRKDGYRFTGRRIGAGAGPVRIVVTKVDGPAPGPLKPAPPPVSRAEERAMARAVIAPVWKGFQPGVREMPGPYAKAANLALVDTARIVAMIEDQILAADQTIIVDLALGLHADDPRAAVAALDAIRPPELAVEGLLGLAERAPDAPADLRDDMLTRALARAREVDEPALRVGLMARAADLRFESGQPEKARRELDEARAAFRNLDSGDSRDALTGRDARAELARAIARVDLPAAEALLEPGGTEANWVGLARRAGANDPAGAQRIYARLKDRRSRLAALPDLCAGMAGRDLPSALALTRDGAPGVAALAVAAAARSKAADDPAAARKLLAEAYDRLEPLNGQMVVASVSMARLLPLAVRIDPARSSEYLWRAIAARAPRSAIVGNRSSSLLLAQLAALAARYDREAAETIFAPVAENAPALVDDHAFLSEHTAAILRAASAFDPRAAVAMVDAMAEDPEPSREPQPGGPLAITPRTKEMARIAVARALALPHALARREALRVPGSFDLWPAALDEGFHPPVLPSWRSP